VRPAALGVDRHLIVVDRPDRPGQPGLDPDVHQVVQQVLGLVLEAQDADAGALLDVGQRHARLALDVADRMPVGAGARVTDSGHHALLERRRHRVLEPLGLLVHVVPRDAEDVGQEALDQPVPAHDRGGVVAAAVGEEEGLVGLAGDVAVALQAADHLVHGGGGQVHGPREVGAGHRQPGLLEPVDPLQVFLFCDRRLVRHSESS
jgi:hypothetical protein